MRGRPVILSRQGGLEDPDTLLASEPGMAEARYRAEVHWFPALYTSFWLERWLPIVAVGPPAGSGGRECTP